MGLACDAGTKESIFQNFTGLDLVDYGCLAQVLTTSAA